MLESYQFVILIKKIIGGSANISRSLLGQLLHGEYIKY